MGLLDKVSRLVKSKKKKTDIDRPDLEIGRYAVIRPSKPAEEHGTSKPVNIYKMYNNSVIEKITGVVYPQPILKELKADGFKIVGGVQEVPDTTIKDPMTKILARVQSNKYLQGMEIIGRKQKGGKE